jgi:ribosomal protein S18 acetylase RimI-like enzyme
MGGGAALPDAVLARNVAALAAWPTAVVLLALDAVSGGALGVATCFRGWSTFAARPLLNVHDLAVLPAHRRRGVARALLAAVEEAARREGAAKVTLEVRLDNAPAQALYRACGFTFQARAAARAACACACAVRLTVC